MPSLSPGSVQQQVEMYEPRIEKGADLSEDGLYRYKLWRIWDRSLPVCVWVMLNPSTADAEKDDATIRRCIGFAKQWGYGGIVVINVFALRATNPAELASAQDPVGPRNDDVIETSITQALQDQNALVVAAWGGSFPPSQFGRVDLVRRALRRHGAKCLGRTRAGEPKHPVRLPYATKLRAL